MKFLIYYLWIPPPHNNTHLKVWVFRENTVPIPKYYGALLPTMGAALHQKKIFVYYGDIVEKISKR